MKSRFLIAAVAFLGYAIIDGQAAHAADKYFDDHDGANSLWSNDANWADACTNGNELSQPTATELATICIGKIPIVNDTSSVALRVVLKTGTTRINIDPEDEDATLTLGSSGPALVSTLEASTKIRLMNDDQGAGTFVARLWFVAVSHTVAGAGAIVGEDNDAEINIDNVTLTLTAEINGHLIIRDGASTGIFHNHGAVIANAANGTLDMAAGDAMNPMDDNSGSGRWKVEGSSTARLLFSVEPAALDGGFTVSNGTLQAGTDLDGGDDIDVDTSAALLHTGGKIFAGINDSFMFGPVVRP